MSNESDINYLVGGFLLGGLVSAPIAFSIYWYVREVPLGVPLAVCGLGWITGIAVGYLFSWMAKNRKRKRVARAVNRQQANAPTPMPTQIAGKTCLGCEKHIVFAPDGSFCSTCHEPFCNRCKNRAAVCGACVEKTPG